MTRGGGVVVTCAELEMQPRMFGVNAHLNCRQVGCQLNAIFPVNHLLAEVI